MNNNGSYTMMAKPMKTLELHYPMIVFNNLRYQVTELLWLQYYGHLVESGRYGKIFYGTLGQHVSMSPHGYFGMTTTRQGSNKLAWYFSAKVIQNGTTR